MTDKFEFNGNEEEEEKKEEITQNHSDMLEAINKIIDSTPTQPLNRVIEQPVFNSKRRLELIMKINKYKSSNFYQYLIANGTNFNISHSGENELQHTLDNIRFLVSNKNNNNMGSNIVFLVNSTFDFALGDSSINFFYSYNISNSPCKVSFSVSI